MGRGNTDLSSHEYDQWLAQNKKESELRERHRARQTGKYEGWHFGLGPKPVYTKDKAEFIKALDKRGLAIKDGYKIITLANGKKEIVNGR